jgi:para-nitrobenzyl esterase
LGFNSINMNKTEIVNTTTGKLQGYTEDGLSIFKGIPYAEPPIGKLRFLPPVKKAPWEGMLDATEYGPSACQGYSRLEEYMGKIEPESEDCLFLNVWTPGIDDKKRPVMFWIHGGGFTTGGGGMAEYNGSKLAKHGDVVIVTINYRLGALGFLYIPGVTVNAGMFDQILALKWVKDNIEKFGGDPDNVTIFGQSAGGDSVLTLPAMPAAKGLFRRIIAQSAPYIYPESDKKSSRKYMRFLGVKSGKVEDLQDIPIEKIMAAQDKIYAQDALRILVFRPLVDGDTLPIHPLKAFENGDNSDIDFMIGTNLDEIKFYVYLIPTVRDAKEDDRMKLATGWLGMKGINAEKANEIIETYKEAREGKYSTEPLEILVTLITDYMFTIQTHLLLKAQSKHSKNVYSYLFQWQSPGMDGAVGACHSLEVPFVFNNLIIPNLEDFIFENAETSTLSVKMMDAWIAFAHTGNPNHDGLPEWPSYEVNSQPIMILDKECKVANAVFEKERAAWDGLLEF